MAYSTIDDPTLYFNTVLYTGDLQDSDGTGHTQSITGVGFQPDWVWHKGRSGARTHMLVDRVRGVSSYNWLASNSTGAEVTTNTNGAISSINSDGITVENGNDSSSKSNNAGKNGETWVFWNWLAGGTAPAITYTVKVVSDSGNKYRFDDFGTSAVTLDLQEGGTYTFDLSDSSNDGHPMKFSETSNGSHGGGSTYSTGVVYQLDGASVTEANYYNTSNFNSASSRKIIITVAASAPTLYYFCHYHSGMGGQANTNSTFGSSNFSGSIQSTSSAGSTQGFSIVSYTGTGSAATVGHGLGATPKMIIVKNRDDSTKSWVTQITALGNNYLELNNSNDKFSGSTYFNNTAPTSSVFTVGTVGSTNASSDNFIAYCFSEVKGYSKIGSYTGGSNPFVYLGFKPAWVLIKRTNANSTSWVMHDNKRNPFNAVDDRLWADSTNTSTTSSSYDIDFLSVGIKIKSTNSLVNTSGGSYIYMAFAESPFVNSNGIPTNAR